MRVRTLEESLRTSFSNEVSTGGINIDLHGVEIREYPQCLGNSPSCSSGPQISLDCKYNPQPRQLSLNQHRTHKNSSYEILIPEDKIIERLLELGYSI